MKYKVKSIINNENKTNEEFSILFNRKLLKVILYLEYNLQNAT